MITFKVGDKEQHEVSFNYDTMWGNVKILVDNKEQISSRVMFVGHTPFTFQIGDKEKHVLRIELDNELGFAFRGSDVKIFSDEQLIRQEHVSGNTAPMLISLVILIVMVAIGIAVPFIIQLLYK